MYDHSRTDNKELDKISEDGGRDNQVVKGGEGRVYTSSSDEGSAGCTSKCSDVANKLAQLFGWRHKYEVQRLHQVNNVDVTQRYSVGNKGSFNNNNEKIIYPWRDAVSQFEQLTKKGPQSGKTHSRSTPDLKSAGSWVAVHSLQSREGGILDPDDRLLDVADDREQIVATFEDGDEHHHHGGDGASGSSVGTPSPDIFQGTSSTLQDKYRNDIEVTTEQIQCGMPAPLQVRRGSEPALNQLLPNTASSNSHLGSALPSVSENSKRWSAAPIITDSKETSTKRDERGVTGLNGGDARIDLHKWRSVAHDEEGDDEIPLRLHVPFSRDGTNRLSMQFLGDSPGGLRWADAAERAVNSRIQSLSLPRESRRKEPLGQATSPVNNRLDDSTEFIVLNNTEKGKLGIHVVPDYDSLGKDRGLLVQRIEPDGRVIRDGRLSVYDRIIEINGSNLLDQPFNVVQDIFRDSLGSPELRLRVVKYRGSMKKPPPPVYPKPPALHTHSSDKENNSAVVSDNDQRGGSGREVSPAKKVPVAGGALLTANTRKMGRKMELELLKGQHGLGFSVTTRDNPAGGNCPIYIKNILPKGAAVEDGRLKPGDRLLAVDGVELTGKSQSEAVAVLRNVPLGSKVRIIVSRQEETPVSATSNTGNVRSVDSVSAFSSLPANVNSNINNKMAPATLPFKALKTDNNYNSNNNRFAGNSSSHNISNASSNSSPTNQISNQLRQTDKNSSGRSNKSRSGHSDSGGDQSQSIDENYVYPWRQKEILTFNIPVHDTEKAGLGVSVKGKTSASQGPGCSTTTSVDLGIFIKNVLHGGAASRDGRLKTNDQLMNVNGISLLGLSNTIAMETLRRAMIRTEGPVEGAITLTVARRIAENQSHQRRDSVSSLLTDSSANTETFGSVLRDAAVGHAHHNSDNSVKNHSGTSDNSDSTVIFMPTASAQKPIVNHLDGIGMRNPVLDRLTGQTCSLPAGVGNLHNESYYRATHQTTIMSLGGGVNNKLNSPTVNQPSGETVIIEEDSAFPQNRPATGSDPSVNKQSRGSTSSATTTGDATYASQLSLDESIAAGFSRDAFGRQSMSEKRHATLDARNTDTYQRNKRLREEREKMGRPDDKELFNFSRDAVLGGGGLIRVNSAESIPRSDTGNNEINTKNQLGPSLGMKKSSSLESLQTMVQEIQMAEDASTFRNSQGAVRVIRGRGCNESFRAAVDRSYDAPLSLHEIRMDTLAEDEGEFVLGHRQSSLDSKLKGKKKPGILKGIGHMFRFGKHRKSMEGGDEEEKEKEIARRVATEEQDRIQEQYKRLVQQQQQMAQVGSQPQHVRELGVDAGVATPTNMCSAATTNNAVEPSRTERIQQLRAQHQRRHVERRGHYPLDEHEERYEQVIRQRLEHKTDLDPINRPGSRIGITDPAKFSHYVNYQEIQHHLNMEKGKIKLRRPVTMGSYSSLSTINQIDDVTGSSHDTDESRRQQHYHSQRRDNRELSHRPVSNFYEYESVQAVMRTQHQNHDVNSNSLPRRPDGHLPAPTHGLSGSILSNSSNHSNNYNNHVGGSARGYPPFNVNSLYYSSTGSTRSSNSSSHKNHNHNDMHHYSLAPAVQSNSSSSLTSATYHSAQNQRNANSLLLSNSQRSKSKPLGPFVTHVTIRECQQQAGDHGLGAGSKI